MPVVVAGLKGVPHAGDMLRATSSESRARDIAEARATRAQTRHHADLDKLSKDHFDTVLDESTGTEKQYAPTLLLLQISNALQILAASKNSVIH